MSGGHRDRAAARAPRAAIAREVLGEAGAAAAHLRAALQRGREPHLVRRGARGAVRGRGREVDPPGLEGGDSAGALREG